MSNSDTRQFIQETLLRYDPNIDLSEGSRADSEVVEPIMQRIGIDPFDEENLRTFVVTRVAQSFPNIAITEADEFTDTVGDPMRVLIEPIVREVKLAKLRMSLRNAESLSDDEVEALGGNFFTPRVTGGFAVGVVRIYFATPQSVSLTQTNPATTKSGLRFMPTRSQAITADQMLLNRDGSEFYFDVNYTAEQRGDQYNVDPQEIVSVANLPTAVRMTNPRRFRNGAPAETKLEYVARLERSLGDKTLTVERGVIGSIQESFPDTRRIFTVGFRDPEMQRDIIRGGSLGPIPADDVDGPFYGSGTAVDDLDGDLLTPILDAPTGSFVSRLGATGTVPEGWFVTISYAIGPTLTMFDAQVLEVVSATQVRIDREMPVQTPALIVIWALRERLLTISDIPGGIVLPDAADGTLEIRKDEVHIGGKTDVYVAGATDLATAQITSLTDENPSAKGDNAQTQGLTLGNEDLIILNDGSTGVEAGFSLVLEEGVDAGSYRILEITSTSPLTVRVDTDMTGSQGSLAWKAVNEIDVELTDPKDVKIEGSDMVTAAGNPVVTTSSAANFLDANVQAGDVLELFDEDFGGEFIVEEVAAVQLTVTPAPGRTFTAVAYRVFRRSEGVEPPLVRIQSMELLDSTGAPSGTKIPYREPVLALSNAFQNEGSGFAYEGLCRVGLVSRGVTTGSAAFLIGGTAFLWEAYDKDAFWGGALDTNTMTFSPGNKTAAQVVAEINANAAMNARGIKARVITHLGLDYVGILSSYLVTLVSGTALATLGYDVGATNSQLRCSSDDPFTDAGVRLGDAVEIVEGNSAGIVGRVITGPIADMNDFDTIRIGTGPVGPEANNGLTGLYNHVLLNPDVASFVRIGRASIGSARVYFLDPTSAEFDYRTTRFTASVPAATLTFLPDPENLRVVRPPPPTTELPDTGVTASGSPGTLTDAQANFLMFGIQTGDLVDILYIPIVGTGPLPPSGNIAFTGLNNTLRIRFDTDPFITISFPFPMPRQDAVDFINEQVGVDVASLTSGGNLQFRSSRRIELDPTSTVITHGSNPLFLAGLGSYNSDHPDRGTFIVIDVTENTLSFSEKTQSVLTGTTPDTFYRIRRYVQRISPTEMNTNLESSGLYYFDVQMLSLTPGDVNNIQSGVSLDITGVRSDGFRLSVENDVTSFSRAEVLHAHLSRSILLVGSADDPTEAVQLSQQNIQVTYDRSQLVDEIQSFCDSNFHRVLCEEILVRHLLPHYVSMTWNYAGGGSEADVTNAMNELLEAVEPDEDLEVTDLTQVIRSRSATSVFTPDASVSNGRTAPFFIVVFHDAERKIRAIIVKDVVSTVRTQCYVPDKITLTRITTGGIR